MSKTETVSVYNVRFRSAWNVKVESDLKLSVDEVKGYACLSNLERRLGGYGLVILQLVSPVVAVTQVLHVEKVIHHYFCEVIAEMKMSACPVLSCVMCFKCTSEIAYVVLH